MYDLIQGIAFIAFMVVFVFIGIRYKIPTLKTLILGLCTIVIDLLLVKVVTWIELGFQSFGSENTIRVYVFAPLFFYIMARIARVDSIKFFDMQALAGPLVYGIGHYACIFAGCCHGFSYYEGTTMHDIAYALTGTNMLPLQFFESTSALMVWLIIFIVGKKRNFNTNGELFFLWYLIFGSTRFFWEFLRDNQKVIPFVKLHNADGYFGISNLAIWSLLMVISGVIVYAVILKKQNSSTEKQ